MTGSHDIHRCRVCSEEFSQHTALVRHMALHSGPMPFFCNHCGKRFSQKCNMKRHTMMHTGEKPFHCRYCAKGFTQKGNLERHMATHTGDKPFACHLCDKKFTQSGNLKIHLLRHTGERPFECHLCDRKFTVKGNLQIHLLRHINDECFVCEVCKEGFLDIEHFTQHVVTQGHVQTATVEQRRDKPSRLAKYTTQREPTQTLYKCGVCDKIFTTKYNLDRHCREHGDERFTCDYCDMQFTHPSNFKRHMLTHTDRRPYECDICHKEFRQKSNLKQHIKTHDVPEPEYDNEVLIKENDCEIEVEYECELNEDVSFQEYEHTNVEVYSNEVQNPDESQEEYYVTQSPGGSICIEKYKENLQFEYDGQNDLLQDKKGYVDEKEILTQDEVVYAQMMSEVKSEVVDEHFVRNDNCYVCDQCGEVFTEHHSLKKHLLFHVDRPTIVVVV